MRVVVEQVPAGHHHPGGAEAALQGVLADETLLDRVEDAVALEVLDRADVSTARHGCEHRAALDRLTVHPHDAGAAVGGVATPMRARQAEVIADEVHEEQTGLDVAGYLFTAPGHA